MSHDPIADRQPPIPEPFVSITLLRYPPRKRWWAISQMRLGPGQLAATPGVRFSRMMGSGKGEGFSAEPNLRVYAMVAAWHTIDAFHDWHEGEWFGAFRRRSEQMATVLQYPIRARGSWGGDSPFSPVEGPHPSELRTVITRASIRTSRLLHFWSTVPSTSRATIGAVGRIFSIGIGEFPWTQQATWSLWESEAAIQQFAYRGHAHLKAIRRTRTLNWYSEELFARFVPLAVIGSWDGIPDLRSYGVAHYPALPSPAVLRAGASPAAPSAAQ